MNQTIGTMVRKVLLLSVSKEVRFHGGEKMSKKNRSLLIITIILVMLASTLTGCSSKKVEKNKEDSKPVSDNLIAGGEKKYGNTKGFIWEIKKDNAAVYLFGSIHIAKKDMYPFEKTIEDAFSSSSNLVVEVDVSDTAKMLKSQSKLIYAGNDDVYSHISKQGKEKLDSYAKELGMDINTLKKMKLWVIESAIQQIQLQKAGYSSGDGVDMYFLNKAKNIKKVLELESVDFQFDMLNSLTEKEQEELLLADVKDLKECETEFNEMYTAYKNADEKALTEDLNDLAKEDPISYKKILVDRNAGMANKIDEYLKTNDSYFVVAGLDHFLGDDSVVKLLENKGYTIIRP